jgi:hypothetical protein
MNVPANSQDMINHIFKDWLDNGVIASIDDILIYSKDEQHEKYEKYEIDEIDEKEYDRLGEEVLKRLSEND